MFRKIENFDDMKPFFDNGKCKWYVDSFFKNYLETEQDFNLPKVSGYGCFIVRDGSTIEDYVLIDNNQTVIRNYPYNAEGHEQMRYFINFALKINKHYDEHGE